MEQSFDVAVIGGGPAGITASLAAAINEASVCLVEQRKFLGGNASLGVPFQGFHDNAGNQIVGGLSWKIIEALSADESACPPWFFTGIRRGGGSMIVHDPHKTREIFRSLLLERGVVIQCGSTEIPAAKVYVDATGNGDFAVSRGAKYVIGNARGECQPTTLLLVCDNLDCDRLLEDIDSRPELYELTENCDYRSYYNAGGRFVLNWHDDSLYDPVTFLLLPVPGNVLLSMIHLRGIGQSTKQILCGWNQARTWITWAMGFVREHLPGCAGLKLKESSPYLGIREGRRVVCDKMLTIEDMTAGTPFDDGIGLGARSVDLHDPTKTGRQPCGSYYRVFSQPYSIPWGALLPRGLDDTLVTGRCISVDYQGFGSTRMMAQCMATGEAAGTASALSIRQNVSLRSLDMAMLQDVLRAKGTILETRNAVQ